MNDQRKRERERRKAQKKASEKYRMKKICCGVWFVKKAVAGARISRKIID